MILIMQLRLAQPIKKKISIAIDNRDFIINKTSDKDLSNQNEDVL